MEGLLSAKRLSLDLLVFVLFMEVSEKSIINFTEVKKLSIQKLQSLLTDGDNLPSNFTPLVPRARLQQTQRQP